MNELWVATELRLRRENRAASTSAPESPASCCLSGPSSSSALSGCWAGPQIGGQAAVKAGWRDLPVGGQSVILPALGSVTAADTSLTVCRVIYFLKALTW